MHGAKQKQKKKTGIACFSFGCLEECASSDGSTLLPFELMNRCVA